MEGQKVQNLLRPALGVGPDSPPFILARQGPWIGSPRVGVLKKSRRWSGTEGPIVENPPEAHKGRQGFSSQLPNRLAIFPAWKWGGGGGADPSELAVGCC